MSLAPLQSPSVVLSRSGGRIELREVRCQTLIHDLNYGGTSGYTANLYKGCTHGCVYCYAPSLTHDERKWGGYVDVKVNAPEVLDRELGGLRKDQVFLSSASDPYQPVEARYGITRRCLEVLLKHGFPASILTRSPLVLRDIELLRRFEWVRVGMSITTVPVRRFEPGVPPLKRRLDTLRKLHDAGLHTWVSLAPVIPRLMMVDLEELFEEFRDAGVRSVSYGVLRFAGYEESKKLFEQTAGISTPEALVGKDAVVAKLSSLVTKYGMHHTNDRGWRPEGLDSISLDGFCG